MKGKIIPLSFLHTQDSETGHQVIRMTPPHVICHRNYFYQKCFTRDGSKLIFGGAFEGHWNYYLLDIAAQQATQLTDGPGDNTFGGFLSADDRSLWYVKNNQQLRRVDLASLEEQVVYQVDDQWVAYGTWVANSDCSQMVGIEIKKRLAAADRLGQVPRLLLYRAECRLINIDLRSGERALLQEKRWLGHPIYRPFDDRPSPSATKARAMLSTPNVAYQR
jgi:oligogalacturonide lyase